MPFVGDDCAEDHHDVEVQDVLGRMLARARLPEGAVGVSRLHELIGRLAEEIVDADDVAEEAGAPVVAVGHRDRSRALGFGAGGRWLPGVRHQSVAGGPIS
ncbi:transposase IS116/IS110/IS902 [Acidothermus cellulolyticus 11B]|uniref:Transposase IS116/IS110/IS902 n=1 Tax=Acidothermus cellulolyticus (strain ATCC 43068 / DSM 8971 / 11B) TaxID=351607 RepID=A0LVH8_ACIC1|nr:transposase IS116/IS110/IS902 [Acidothermus cellulolyticus 11B]